MEDTLRGCYFDSSLRHTIVLILVLMEDTLREVIQQIYILLLQSLNPCFNGRYSQRHR